MSHQIMANTQRDFWSVVLPALEHSNDGSRCSGVEQAGMRDEKGVEENVEQSWKEILATTNQWGEQLGNNMNLAHTNMETNWHDLWYVSETSTRVSSSGGGSGTSTTESEEEVDELTQAAELLVALRESAVQRTTTTRTTTTAKSTTSRFQCDVCKALFRRKSYLRKHVNAVHKKLKPFTCGICAKPFGYKGARAKHHRTIHLGQKPFVCVAPTCSMRFSEKGNMKKHFRNRHT